MYNVLSLFRYLWDFLACFFSPSEYTSTSTRCIYICIFVSFLSVFCFVFPFRPWGVLTCDHRLQSRKTFRRWINQCDNDFINSRVYRLWGYRDTYPGIYSWRRPEHLPWILLWVPGYLPWIQYSESTGEYLPGYILWGYRGTYPGTYSGSIRVSTRV